MWDVEIFGEAVKAGMAAELIRSFQNTVYTEQATEPQFPHFFIEQLTLSSREERKGYWWLEYLMHIRYRVAADIALVRDLQAELDRASLAMLAKLKTINLGGVPIKILNPRTEKSDGVLFYFCNFKIQATHALEEKIKQQHLDINKTVKEK